MQLKNIKDTKDLTDNTKFYGIKTPFIKLSFSGCFCSPELYKVTIEEYFKFGDRIGQTYINPNTKSEYIESIDINQFDDILNNKIAYLDDNTNGIRPNNTLKLFDTDKDKLLVRYNKEYESFLEIIDLFKDKLSKEFTPISSIELFSESIKNKPELWV